MRLPENPNQFLGLALLIAITSFSAGGLIGAFNSIPPTDGEIQSITGLISFLAGALTGSKLEELRKP